MPLTASQRRRHQPGAEVMAGLELDDLQDGSDSEENGNKGATAPGVLAGKSTYSCCSHVLMYVSGLNRIFE